MVRTWPTASKRALQEQTSAGALSQVCFGPITEVIQLFDYLIGPGEDGG